MYNVVLAALLMTGGEATSWNHCHGCWGCTGCFGSRCSGCYGCHGRIGFRYYNRCHGWGCYGGASVPMMPPVAVQLVPGVRMPDASDPALSPQSEAEREAIRTLLKTLREETKKKPQEEVRAPAAPARLTINVPADARLWVDQVECPLTSAVRSFNSPALQPGHTYFYTLKVQVQRDGAPVTDSQRVPMAAGENITVDFSNVGTVSTAQR